MKNKELLDTRRVNGWNFQLADDSFYECRGGMFYDDDHDETIVGCIASGGYSIFINYAGTSNNPATLIGGIIREPWTHSCQEESLLKPVYPPINCQ